VWCDGWGAEDLLPSLKAFQTLINNAHIQTD
jgi:hypothetical protein